MSPTYPHLLSPIKLGLIEVPKFGHKTNEPNTDFTLSAVDYVEVNAQGEITRFLPIFASSEIPRVLTNINRHGAEAADPKKAEPVL